MNAARTNVISEPLSTALETIGRMTADIGLTKHAKATLLDIVQRQGYLMCEESARLRSSPNAQTGVLPRFAADMEELWFKSDELHETCDEFDIIMPRIPQRHRTVMVQRSDASQAAYMRVRAPYSESFASHNHNSDSDWADLMDAALMAFVNDMSYMAYATAYVAVDLGPHSDAQVGHISDWANSVYRATQYDWPPDLDTSAAAADVINSRQFEIVDDPLVPLGLLAVFPNGAKYPGLFHYETDYKGTPIQFAEQELKEVAAKISQEPAALQQNSRQLHNLVAPVFSSSRHRLRAFASPQ